MIKKKISRSDIVINKKISLNDKNDIIYNLYHNNKLLTQAFVITEINSKTALIYNDYKLNYLTNFFSIILKKIWS